MYSTEERLAMIVESNPCFTHYVSEWYQYCGKLDNINDVDFVPGNKYRLVEMGYANSSKKEKLFGIVPYRKNLGMTYNVIVCTSKFVFPVCYSSEDAFKKYWTKCE